MHLAPGSRLGIYEITARIGAGGMGEVYRATDTRLKRPVAIKVLLPSLAGDADRLARFQREAEVLASLNHPNIAAIHGLDRSDGHTALVMELVEGPTLAERLAQGAVPLDETMAIATQIAEALEAAHERGIIHRDLKPANIKVRPDGAVKVLDFGLAKAADPVAAGPAGLASLATITSPALTQLGMILGTAAYMSPEQARGRAVDKRTDIWAFGCVLFEMLAGARPFEGDDVTEVIGAVIHKDVDWMRLPRTTPAAMRTALERCLEKDPRKRIRDMGDVRLALNGAFAVGTATVATPAVRRGVPAWAAASVAVLAAVAGGTAIWIARAPSPPASIAFTVDTGRTATPASLALSPDGRLLVFTRDDDGVQKLWIRALDSTTARVIPGTDQASVPFWSPDSTRIGFLAGNLLKQVDLLGSAPQTIAETGATVPLGGTWNDRDVILFSRGGTGILRVAATGGVPHPVTSPLKEEIGHSWPVFLPDGDHFLYLRIGSTAEGGTKLVWRSLDSTDEHVVRSVPSSAWYSPTGHVIFRSGDAVVAQRFDPSNGTVSGNTVQLTDSAWWLGSRLAFSLSPAGVIAYRPSPGAGAVSQLSWIDRSGKTVGQVGTPGDYYENLVMDRSAARAATNTPGDTEDVWVIDLARGTKSRITFDAETDSDPVLSPGGESVAFYSWRSSGAIYRRPSNGAGTDELIAQTGIGTWPRDWSPDGRFILYQSQQTADLWVLPLAGDRKPYPYLTTPSSERDGRFSPDGRWVAYASDETGRNEVFIQDFPAKGVKLQVSAGGGVEARWRADGRELFYLDPEGTLMSVDVTLRPTFKLGVPKALFKTQLMNLPLNSQRRYAVSRDGRRFLMNLPLDAAAQTPVTVIVNWQSMVAGR